MLPIEKLILIRVACLSKFDKTLKANSIFNTNCAKFSTKQYVLLNFQNLTCV